MGRSTVLSVSCFLLFALCCPTSLASTTSTCKDGLLGGNYKTCIDLPTLDASLYWTYYPSNSTATIAFRVTGVTSPSWISWGLNPTGSGMKGTQAMIAYQKTDGTMRAYTSSIDSYQTRLAESPLSFSVWDLSAEIKENEMIMHASIQLPPGKTTLNHVWQVGPVNANGHLLRHSFDGANVNSVGQVDFASGTAIAAAPSGGLTKRNMLKNVHGILCTLGFGILMPLGVLMSRYKNCKRLPFIAKETPAFPCLGARAWWFMLHLIFQITGCLLGLAGLGIGLVLVAKSLNYGPHFIIGLTILFCSILQFILGYARPGKQDKMRPLWEACHYIVGYSTLVLGSANVFLGLGMIGASSLLKTLYIVYVVVIGSLWVLSFPLILMQEGKNEKSKTSTQVPAEIV